MSDIQIDHKVLLSNGVETFEPYVQTDSELSTTSILPIQTGPVTTELNTCLRYEVQGTSQSGGSIVTSHSISSHLDYANSGHTGFASTADLQQVLNLIGDINSVLNS